MANKATFKNMADSAEGVANRAMEQGREAAEGTQEVAGNIKSVVDKSVRINRWPRSLWPLLAAI